MQYVRIVKIVAVLLFPILTIAQNVKSTEDFIAYKFPVQADSLLTKILDSASVEQINGMLIYLDLRNSKYIVNGTDLCYNCFIELSCIYDLKKQMGYGAFLTKNTNHYYVSMNKKYKIPIIFVEDDVFIFDRIKYPSLSSSTTGKTIVQLSLMNDTVISVVQGYYFK